MACKFKVIAKKDIYGSFNYGGKIILRKGEFLVVERKGWTAGGLSGDELKEAFLKRFDALPNSLDRNFVLVDKNEFDVQNI